MGNVLVAGGGDEFFSRAEAEAAENYSPEMKLGLPPEPERRMPPELGRRIPIELGHLVSRRLIYRSRGIPKILPPIDPTLN